MLLTHIRQSIVSFCKSDYKTLNLITLNTQAMLDNVSLFQSTNPKKEIIPILKGNAYGHGLKQTAQILDRSSCRYIAVDGYFEAMAVRNHCSQQILVMGYIATDNVRLLDLKRCSFVVQDIASLEAFGALNKSVRIHVELNTGMNRLGLELSELDAYLSVLKQYPKLQLEGVMTHLADADNAETNAYTQRQVKLFDRGTLKILTAGFQPKLIHIAQTAGSIKVHSKYANALRVGLGTYGINPLQPSDPQYTVLTALKPVLQLTSTVIKVLQLAEGEKVSYNGTFTAPRTMRVAVLPVGYYEGLPRTLSNVGHLSVGNRRLSIAGRICMNHVMIDITNTNIKIGDRITVISRDAELPNSVLGLQRDHQIFSYNLLTSLAPSIRRLAE